MANPEISLAISATSFGLVIGFVAGYATAPMCHTFVAVRKTEQRRRQALLAKATTTVLLQSPEAHRRVKSKLGE